MKTAAPLLVLTARQEALDALAAAGPDVRSAGRITAIELRKAELDEPLHEVEL
jgi:hypothetical protein